MMKQYKKELIVSTLLALLPIAAGLLLWNRLPGQLATHWGMHGADRWSGKSAAVFLQPLLLLAAHYLVLFFVFRDAKNRNQSKKVVGLLFWMIPAVSILVSGITYAVALGWEFRLAGLLYVGLGLMFAAIGNYFPKCRPNRTVGIRIIWTLGSEENWNATHRFAGKVWVIGGLIMVLAALLPEVPGIIVMILAVAALSILPLAYSYRYHRIHGTKSEPDPLSKKISVGMLIFTALMLAAIGLADMVSGIFKSNGVLGGLLPDFEPRPRPMFTPSLEGLDITPDSLRVMRREAVPRHWAVHVPPEAVSGMYGTVSAHAATIVALAVLSCGAIRRKWFTALMVVCTLVICYSRIYLGKHFPMDLVWGSLVGAALAALAWKAFKAKEPKEA